VEPPIPEFLAKKFVIIPSRTTSSQETNQSETINQVWIGKKPTTNLIWIYLDYTSSAHPPKKIHQQVPKLPPISTEVLRYSSSALLCGKTLAEPCHTSGENQSQHSPSND